MSVKEKHREAMRLVDQAHEALKKAYILERECADSLEAIPANEPTRSILYRSAGWIAAQRGRYYIAIDCAEKGIEGVLSAEIRQELIDLKLESERRGNAADDMSFGRIMDTDYHL